MVAKYKCMCVSQWSILVPMLLLAGVAAAVVLGVGVIRMRQSIKKCVSPNLHDYDVLGSLFYSEVR